MLFAERVWSSVHPVQSHGNKIPCSFSYTILPQLLSSEYTISPVGEPGHLSIFPQTPSPSSSLSASIGHASTPSNIPSLSSSSSSS